MKLNLLFALLLSAVSWSQSPDIKTLLDRLPSPNEGASASSNLKSLAAVSPANRDAIRNELSGRLADRSNLPLWRSEVTPAGQLGLVELAPAIAESLDYKTKDSGNYMGGMYRDMSIDFDPAAKALASIGGAAVPALSKELAVGNRSGRYRAVTALANIPGPEAEETLRQQLATEKDEALRGLIARELEIRSRPKK